MKVKSIYLFVCVMCGLWGGLVIGLITEIFTSNAWRPVQEVAEVILGGPVAFGVVSWLVAVKQRGDAR